MKVVVSFLITFFVLSIGNTVFSQDTTATAAGAGRPSFIDSTSASTTAAAVTKPAVDENRPRTQEECILAQRQEVDVDPTPDMLSGEARSESISKALSVSGISLAAILVVMAAFGGLTGLLGRFFPGEED